MHVPLNRFTRAMFIRLYMMNCQMVDTDSNCLRAQTRGGGQPVKTSQVNFRLYSWKNPGASDRNSKIRRAAWFSRKNGDFVLSSDIPAKRTEQLRFIHGIWMSAVTCSLRSFSFCHDLMLLMGSWPQVNFLSQARQQTKQPHLSGHLNLLKFQGTCVI